MLMPVPFCNRFAAKALGKAAGNHQTRQDDYNVDCNTI